MLMGKGKNLRWADLNMAELDLTKLVSHFAQSNKAEGKSLKTVSWYTEMLLDFVRFVRSSDRETILAELNTFSVRDFIIREQNRGLSPYTVQGKVRALKAFSSWLMAEGYTSEKEADAKKMKLELELAAKMKQFKVKQEEVEELSALKVRLSKQGLDISTLIKLTKEFTHVKSGG